MYRFHTTASDYIDLEQQAREYIDLAQHARECIEFAHLQGNI